MLFSKLTAVEKRRNLSKSLAGDGIIRAPGAFSPLVAMEVERHGFEAVYVSGAVLSADLGLPDIGLTTLSEVADRAEQIARVTDLPTLVDCDTGFGEPMNVARTVRVMEERGLAALHLEDQVNPKRCGHLDGKIVVSTEEMIQKIKAAADARRDENLLLIARTDALAVEGFDAMIERANAYAEAGADIVFTEALKDRAEWEKACAEISAPLLANMTEFGISELLPADVLQALGVRVVIYPVSTLRVAMKATRDALHHIARKGGQAGIVEDMQSRQELYDLLRYEDYNRFDKELYNFRL